MPFINDNTPQEFLEKLNKIIDSDRPQEGVVQSYSTGIFEATDDKPAIPYASFNCCDPDEFELFSKINREELTPSFRVKIKGYSGQSLDNFVGQTIDLSSAELVFKLNRFKQPVGFDLVISL